MENNNYKVLVENEEGKVDKEEIKRVIGLLKEKESNHLDILEDLKKLLKTVESEEFLGKVFLEMDFLESAAKIFEDKGNYDENIERADLLKVKDTIGSLFQLMIDYSETKIGEEARKTIFAIAKNEPSAVVNNDIVKGSYENIISLNNDYSSQKKKSIFKLFNGMVKEGIIRKEGLGSELVEEMLFIGEEMERNKDFFNVSEDLIEVANDFVKFAKEKDFGEENFEKKSILISYFIFNEWRVLCKEEKDNLSDVKSEESLKEVDKEKIKNFCNKVSIQPWSVQIEFINRLSNVYLSKNAHLDEFMLFNGRKNGLFLELFLPLFFKDYQIEKTFPLFFGEVLNNYNNLSPCLNYLRELNNIIINRLMKESEKEIEMNEGAAIILIFLWSTKKKEGKKEEEIDFLINFTVKILEWLGRVEEIKEEKDEDYVKEECKIVNGMKGKMNRKEMIVYEILKIIIKSLDMYSEKESEMIKKDGRIWRCLCGIIKKHLVIEKSLIHSGNDFKIIEYIAYSYDLYYESSILSNISYNNFPFSGYIIINILKNSKYLLLDKDYEELIKKDISLLFVEYLNNTLDLMKIANEIIVKKEIKKERKIELDEEILRKKGSFDLFGVQNILFSILDFMTLSSFDNENKNVIKKIINYYFSHNNNNNYIREDKEKNVGEDIEEKVLIRLFAVDGWSRNSFIAFFINSFVSFSFYSVFDFLYLTGKSEFGCNILGIYMKELTGEIVDKIEKKGNETIIKERRSYERERLGRIFYEILNSLKNIMKINSEGRINTYFGYYRKADIYLGKEKQLKEAKNYIDDIIQEEDVKECILLFLKHMTNNNVESERNEADLILCDISFYSKEALSYMF